ncbi:hypothetical protein D3C86_2168630 [compost metagenome]
MRQQMGAGNGHAAYNHTPLPQLGNIRHLLAKQLHSINNGLGLLHKFLAGVRKLHRTGIALEKEDTQLLFQF